MDASKKVISSAFLSALAKVWGKLIGLISTIVVARILNPEDFGTIAVVSMVLYFFDIISHAAGEQYILQKKTVSLSELNSAWTLNFLLKILVSILIILLSSYIVEFFERPEIRYPIIVSTLILCLNALKNPKLIFLKRQLRFKVIFWLSFFERCFALPVLIILAIQLGNYWAFIIADIFASTLGCVLSYKLIKGNPSIRFSAIRQQWNFSLWMLAKSFIGYLRSQIDTIVVAKLFSSNVLGQYNFARDLAMMPAHYLLNPAIEPFITVFKNDKNNVQMLLRNVNFTVLVVCTISIPVCTMMVVFSKPLIFFLLGEGWEIAANLLPALSLLFFYWSIAQVFETALLAQGKVKIIFYYDLISFLLSALSLLFVIVGRYELEYYALARAIAGIISVIFLLFFLYGSKIHLVYSLIFDFIFILAIAVGATIPMHLFGINRFSYDNWNYDLLSVFILSVTSFLFLFIIGLGCVLKLSSKEHLVRLKKHIKGTVLLCFEK